MYKDCISCGRQYKKNPKYSRTQWEKSLHCSSSCFGDYRVGYTHTEETRKVLSLKHKGTKKPWAGKYKHSKEHNNNISMSVRLFYSSPEGLIAKDKMSKAQKGRIMSEETKAKMLESFKKNPKYKGGKDTLRERRAFYQRNREYMKMANGGSHTFAQWEYMKKCYKYTCPSCLMVEPVIKLTEDHIKPISKGGSNDISNIQPLCVKCNSTKHNKEIRYENPYASTE